MSLVLWTLAVLAAVGQALMWAALRKNFRDAPDLGAEPLLAEPFLEGKAAPTLLVIVPARDEEGGIGACCSALLASQHVALRVRVVDDGSRDRTAAIVRELAARDDRLELVTAPALPDGWLGKSHALWSGTRDAVADYLLFVDADVRVQPDAIARALAVAERRRADLVTVMPRIEAHGFWELAAQTLVASFILAWLPSAEVNDATKKRAAGIGPFLLFRRSAYEAIGGHEAVRRDVVEDARLAELVKRAGLRLLYLRGVEQIAVRMYDSLGGIVRGYTKNFHEMVPPWAAPLAAAGVLVLVAGPWLLPPLALALHARGPALVALLALALSVGVRLDLARCYRLTARHPWLAPVGAVVIVWILLGGALRRLTGGSVSWKGRSVR